VVSVTSSATFSVESSFASSASTVSSSIATSNSSAVPVLLEQHLKIHLILLMNLTNLHQPSISVESPASSLITSVSISAGASVSGSVDSGATSSAGVSSVVVSSLEG
jgi:hypothetical protein